MCQPRVDRDDNRVSIASIDRHSIVGVSSTHDPDHLVTNKQLMANIFNKYFVNIASNIKEPVRSCNASKHLNNLNTFS